MPTILVVEDQADLRMLVSILLRTAGYEPVLATDGADGIRVLRQHAHIDAVLLDVQMPDVDGWGVLASIRDEGDDLLPVIMCTVKARPEDEIRGWSLGCDGFLTKPFDIDELIATLEAALGRTATEARRRREDRLAAAHRALAARAS